MRFAVDTGGTFTDLVLEDDTGILHMFKAPTTPDDPVRGILDGIATAAQSFGETPESLLGRGELFIHGTTHATNAIVTGTTARTALLTTKGHPDMLVLREGGRIEPFNFRVPFPRPYVPRSLTFEIPGRIAADGAILEFLDETAVLEVIGSPRSAVEAVGVCLLVHCEPGARGPRGPTPRRASPGGPAHSRMCSTRFWRVPRASSTSIDASLKPLMSLPRRLSRRCARPASGAVC